MGPLQSNGGKSEIPVIPELPQFTAELSPHQTPEAVSLIVKLSWADFSPCRGPPPLF